MQPHTYLNCIVENPSTASGLDSELFAFTSKPRSEFTASSGVTVQPASQSFIENHKDSRSGFSPINQMPCSNAAGKTLTLNLPVSISPTPIVDVVPDYSLPRVYRHDLPVL